jgi:fibronectin-binding autotransporter adhesin
MLVNAGTIIGNVQMIPSASNSVTLTAGGSIHGDLDIGSSYGSSLTLNGVAGTTQLYSQAVTGKTTFAGQLSMNGSGTWVIDNDDLAPVATVISGGTLQVGTGGTTGSIGAGAVTVYSGSLVFDRSDNIIFNASISSGYSPTSSGTLVQAGTGTLTLLTKNTIAPTNILIQSGTLQIDNTGGTPGFGNAVVASVITNNGSLVFDSNLAISQGPISGTGSVTQEGSAPLILEGSNTYSGGTSINGSVLQATNVLPGNVTIGQAGALDGYSGATLHSGAPGVAGDLANAGRVLVHAGDTGVGGNYTQAATGTLAVSLGSKLAVTGTATLNGGTLEVTGADSGYVANTHTDVLTATGGLTGTFFQLIKDAGVVFTSTTIQYNANSVWLDTTGLNVTTAAAGNGVGYTPASMGSALRVQAAFEQLDSKIATSNLSSVSSDFLNAAGQFQQAPTLQAAQASLQSLSGELHAASAAMTFEAIDASNRALSDRFDKLLGKDAGFGVWTQSLDMGGNMARTGYDGVGFQLNGWLFGSDRQIGRSGVAGFAFGQSQGLQQVEQGFGRDNSRSTESMVYAGWLDGNWYTQGRVGFGYFQQDVNRQILLGYSTRGVSTQYSGNYSVAYGESGLYLNYGDTRITPYANAEYASIGRGGFAEQGAGGFGLQSNAQTVDRWQAGLGVRASRHWNLGDGRTVDFSARAQWQRTLASHGDVFDASFVGLQQWQPLTGIGLSRYSGLFGVGLDAMLSARTSLNIGYDYEMGQRVSAQMVSARMSVAF